MTYKYFVFRTNIQLIISYFDEIDLFYKKKCPQYLLEDICDLGSILIYRIETPVISAGLSTPNNSRIVGAISPNLPSLIGC